MFKKLYHFFHKHYHFRYHGTYQHAKQLFIFDLGLLALALTLFGATIWLFFWKPGIANQIEMTISLGEARLRSGEAAHVVVNFSNHSKFKLTNVTLGLRLPPGFIVDADKIIQKEFLQNNIFVIKDLPPGGSGQADVYGWLWSTPLKETKLIAQLTFTPENSSRPEQKLTSFLITLPESVLHASLEVASTTFPNQTVPFLLQLTNTSDRLIKNISIARSFESSEKTFTNIILGPKETKKITGTVNSPSRGSLLLTVTPQVEVSSNLIGQTSIKKSIAILTPNLLVSAKFVNAPAFADGSAKLPLQIQWNNLSNFPLINKKIRLRFLPGVVNLKTTAIDNHLKIEGNDLIIDAKAHTALASGTQGLNDTFVNTLTLLSTFSATKNKLEITPYIETEVPNMPNQIYSVRGETIYVPLATQANMTVESRYYTAEGDQLGRGPLPPRVGETTKYWIFVKINNTVNALRSPRIEIVLEPGISFSGRQSVTLGPELAYNAGINTMRWQFNEIPPNSQTGFYFEVAATPNKEQIGKTINLVKSTSFYAIDDETGKEIIASYGFVSNQLRTDDRGRMAGAQVR